MLHPSADQFRPALQSSTSRVAYLATEYDRWHRLYQRAGEIKERQSEEAASEEELEKSHSAELHAVRRMHEKLDELIMTPAKSILDFGHKARVVREFQNGDWYDAKSQLGRGELLARSMMIELLEINQLTPIYQRDFEPAELIEGYVDPVPKFAPCSPVVVDFPQQAGCMVAEQARRFDRAIRQYNLLDTNRPDDARDFVEAQETATAIMDTSRDAACLAQAKSAEGALFQVISAYGDFSGLSDHLSDPDFNPEAVLACKLRFDVAMKSVRHFMEAHFNIDGRDVGGDYWMPLDLGPVEKLEDLAPITRPPFLQAAE